MLKSKFKMLKALWKIVSKKYNMHVDHLMILSVISHHHLLVARKTCLFNKFSEVPVSLTKRGEEKRLPGEEANDKK